MSGRSRVRRVQVSPVRRPQPDVIRVTRVLVGLALEAERLAQGDQARASAAKGRGSGSARRAA